MVALINIILIPIVMTVAVSADPLWIIKNPKSDKPASIPECLRLERTCLTSDLPCCTLIYKNAWKDFGPVPATCFKFGKGVCQLNQSIKNFNEYNRLASQLNSTNFQELKNKYWSSIPAAFACPQKVTIEVKGV